MEARVDDVWPCHWSSHIGAFPHRVFIGAFPSHGKNGSSNQLLSHHYFTGLVLRLSFSCRKKKSDMSRKKPRSTSRQYCLEVHARLCGIDGVNFLCPVNLPSCGRTREISSSYLKSTLFMNFLGPVNNKTCLSSICYLKFGCCTSWIGIESMWLLEVLLPFNLICTIC